jgi:DNA-binding NarL/FixJ family response regulator
VTPRVVIADRSGFVRLAVRNALVAAGIAVVAEADEAEQALSAIVTVRPDAVLLDAELDEGFAVLAAARHALPGAALIVLSPDASEIRALLAVRAGACGFLPNDTPPDRLPDIVLGAIAGEAAIPRVTVRRLIERLAGTRDASLPDAARADAATPLTARERDVLERLAGGMHDREIGDELGISEITVRRHAATAARKLRVRRREDAVAAFRTVAA